MASPATSIGDASWTQATMRPSAYRRVESGAAMPASSTCSGYAMSAEKNTSNGAPWLICARKLPDDP